MVHRGGQIYARVVGAWTLAEIVGAILFTSLLGPRGLAWSYGLMVWIGLWLMLAAMGQERYGMAKQLVEQVFARPGLLFALTTAISLTLFFKNISPVYSQSLWFFGTLACTVILCSYLLEPDVRQFMMHEKATTP
jgi:lysylphosphatidylglycerol synthetase-like protein (DUF2156 family)